MPERFDGDKQIVRIRTIRFLAGICGRELRTGAFAGMNLPATMDKPAAIARIRDACKIISTEMMKIHPAVPALADKETQDELYKTLFELTKQVETIKKRLAKLEARDASTEL